ncbi:TonB-dependent receptor domain-containing protein [Billgrantia gudaonensis]|uniref:Vitamin B12 transporter n=1 Tax=Billgrantia gudaonensis TaxID=376427 RepID=A0A1G8XX41_9GAMM|nr:TonB-dependent receptor [Halomonas gudaonensis]SDJ94340.1 vitamin B12 transporter [Halomonas gudaonensis]
MNTTRNAPRGLAAFGLAFLPLVVHAQSEPEDDRSVDLNPLVVTAALAPRTADESLSSVTLLDEATLRRQDPVSLTDLFRGQPGVDVTTNGSFGKSSSVSIRGTASDQNVLLIDGIRLRSATLGSAAWQHLDPRMFERAEIVRGPRGSLYGADAIGGVVQLFTHEAEEGSPHPRVSVGGGSFDSRRLSAGLSGSEGGTRYSFAASHFATDGAPIRRGGEDKGYDNTSGLVRLSHAFDGGGEIGLLGLRARGNTEFDGGESDFVQQVAGIYGEVPVTEQWKSRLTLSESRDELDTFNTAFPSTINTRTQTAHWENRLSLASHELIVGAEYSEDQVSGTSDFEVDSRDNTAVFAQSLLDFSPLTVQASLRHDDNEAYGSEVTGSLALGYALDAHHTLRASYGTAFKAPSFNDLYTPFGGDPDLDPETSETFEVGVRGQFAPMFWDLAVYETTIDDLIDWKDQGGGMYAPVQIDAARIRGVELSAGAEIDAWTLQAALTYTDPEDRDTGDRLPRRATQSLRFDVDRELGDWSLGGSWIVQNHRYDSDGEQDRLPGFGLLDLRAGWEFAPMWSARLTLDNVLDKEYETAGGYINAGRAAFLSVHFGG